MKSHFRSPPKLKSENIHIKDSFSKAESLIKDLTSSKEESSGEESQKVNKLDNIEIKTDDESLEKDSSVFQKS